MTSQSFSVSAFSRSGKKLTGPSFVIEAQGKISVDITEWLHSLPNDAAGEFSDGSLAINFINDNIKTLTGQILIANPATGIHFASGMFKNDNGQSGLQPALHLLWWGLADGRDAKFFVSNIAEHPVAADVFLDFKAKRHPGSVLYFGARETKALCVADLLNDLNENAQNVPEGGITVSPRGPEASLIGMGQMSNPSSKFSTTLHLPRLDRQTVSALHATGVPIGTPTSGSVYAGLGTFIPHVIVRNLKGASQNVTLTIEYSGKDGPQQAVLPPVTVDGFSTVDISIDSFYARVPLPLSFCAIRIQYDGAPESISSEIVSTEQNGRATFSFFLTNEGDGYAMSGTSSWHLDAKTESILFLTNMGEDDSRIGFTVKANGLDYYLTNLKLKAHETRAIDLRKLRDSQTEDFRKNKIPVSASDGNLYWSRLDNVPVMGQFISIQRNEEVNPGPMNKGGSARTPSNIILPGDPGEGCPCPDSFDDVGIVGQQPCGILPGETCGWNAMGEWVDCNRIFSFYDVTLDSSWSSTNEGVATVDGSTVPAVITGISPGFALISPYYFGFAYDPVSCVKVPRGRSPSGVTNVRPTVSIDSVYNFIFVATNPLVTRFNQWQATGNPGGGQYYWSTPNPRVTFDNPSASGVTLLGNSPSTTLLDTRINVTYGVEDLGISSASRLITIRIFKFLRNKGVTQIIPQPNGYIAYQYYNIYTSPSGQLLQPGFGDIEVDEIVELQSATKDGVPLSQSEIDLIIRDTGAGATDANSEFFDRLNFMTQTGNPMPSGYVFRSKQDLFVGGIFVRHNTLEQRSDGVNITNGGPNS
ncbi:MAG: hypothetical protein LAO21_21085 [Acidobacteriia bacterium]|nr:hypothetical protein [Terriglobia bacterium]